MIEQDKIISAHDGTIHEQLRQLFLWAEDAYIAVAYASEYGFAALEEAIQNLLDRGGNLCILLDIESGITEYNAILEFATAVGTCETRIFFRPLNRRRGHFHPKLYLFKRGKEWYVVVGSANLTAAGISSNYEACAIYSGTTREPLIKSSVDLFEMLWSHQYALDVANNEELIENYREARELLKDSEYKFSIVSKEALSRITKETFVYETIEIENLVSDINMIYLLGLICGHGLIDHNEKRLLIRQSFNPTNDGLIHGMNVNFNQKDAWDTSMKDLKKVFEETYRKFNQEITVTLNQSSSKNTYELSVDYSNSTLFHDLLKQAFGEYRHHGEFEIPSFVLEGGREITRYFLRGYSDVASLISRGTRLPGDGPYRIYINVYGQNRKLFNQLAEILERHGVKKGLHDRHKTVGKGDEREWQIRVYPEEFARIGFSVFWKKKLLYDFARANKQLKAN